MLLVEEAFFHRGCIGQEGGQVEDRSHAVIHQHLKEGETTFSHVSSVLHQQLKGETRFSFLRSKSC